MHHYAVLTEQFNRMMDDEDVRDEMLPAHQDITHHAGIDVWFNITKQKTYLFINCFDQHVRGIYALCYVCH